MVGNKACGSGGGWEKGGGEGQKVEVEVMGQGG